MGRLPKKKPRQVRDAEATQKQILDAAEEEFAKCGLSGARIEAIASRAGVTSATSYYYFHFCILAESEFNLEFDNRERVKYFNLACLQKNACLIDRYFR